MKNLICLLLVLQAPIAFAQNADSLIIEKWEFFIASRMVKMEELAHVRYIWNSEPKLYFGIPDYIQNQSSFGACYNLSDGSIWVTPAYKNESLHEAYNSIDHIVTRLIDHELVHMYANQMSLRILKRIWPDTILLTTSENFCRNMLSEGVAVYYTNLARGDTANSIEWLPTSSSDIIWLDSKSIIYQGGYYLVKPILDKFGERGLLYIIQNKLDYEDGDVRTAVAKYQKLARKRLR